MIDYYDYWHIYNNNILTKKRRLKKNTAYFTHAIPPSTILLAVICANYVKNAQYVHKCGEFLTFLANKYDPRAVWIESLTDKGMMSNDHMITIIALNLKLNKSNGTVISIYPRQ